MHRLNDHTHTDLLQYALENQPLVIYKSAMDKYFKHQPARFLTSNYISG